MSPDQERWKILPKLFILLTHRAYHARQIAVFLCLVFFPSSLHVTSLNFYFGLNLATQEGTCVCVCSSPPYFWLLGLSSAVLGQQLSSVPRNTERAASGQKGAGIAMETDLLLHSWGRNCHHAALGRTSSQIGSCCFLRNAWNSGFLLFFFFLNMPCLAHSLNCLLPAASAVWSENGLWV